MALRYFLALCVFTCALFSLSAQSEVDDFFKKDQIHNIRIQIDAHDWNDALDSLKFYGDEYTRASVSINGKTIDGAGVRFRGNSSYQSMGKKNSLNIKLNFSDKESNYNGLKKIKLSNIFNDPSFVRETFGYNLAAKYMIAPRANYARVYVNGQFYGLFANLESVDKDFLKRHFGESKGAFIKASPDLEAHRPANCLKDIFSNLEYEEKGDRCYELNYEFKSDSALAPLMELTRVLKTATTPEEIEAVLDVDQTLWMHAYNNVLVNLSSYSGRYAHNYYLYQKKNGQFVPIIWDLNMLFGSFKAVDGGPSLHKPQLQRIDPFLHSNNSERPLIKALMKHKEFRQRYIHYVRTFLYDEFKSGNYLSEIKETQRKISNDVMRDKNAFYNYSKFKQSLQTKYKDAEDINSIYGIEDFMEGRVEFLKKERGILKLAPEIENLTTIPEERFSKMFLVKVKASRKARKVSLAYRFDDSEPYKIATLYDNGRHDDGGKKDGIFAAKIKQEGLTMQYYFIAENDGATSVIPSAYHSDPLTIEFDNE